MFIESATAKKFFLAPAERNIVWSPRNNDGNIAVRWNARYRVRSTIYKHLAPLERKLIPLLHLKVEFTICLDSSFKSTGFRSGFVTTRAQLKSVLSTLVLNGK